MIKHFWFIPALAALVVISGCSPSPQTFAPQTVQTASMAVGPLSPADRKAIEDLALLFAQKYYTYTLDDYTEDNKALLPLLTPEFRDSFTKITENGYLAAQAVKAESKVESVQILEVDKLSSTQGKVSLTFTAQVTNNGKTTKNRYSTKLDLRKAEGQWRINAILSERPVEFMNLRNLL